MKVLVADDDSGVRNALRKVLEEEGYEVVLAADGQQALNQFEGGSIDLLLLDIAMPVKNGWDTFEQIANQNPVLPIIVITGQSNQYKAASVAGVGALMEKPLDVTRLLGTMQELLAEPREARLRRLCGYNRDTRHVPASSSSFLRGLRDHHCATLHGTPSDAVQG